MPTASANQIHFAIEQASDFDFIANRRWEASRLSRERNLILQSVHIFL